MWEGACSRWRCISWYFSALTHRYREQAPSHIWITARLKLIACIKKPCSIRLSRAFLCVAFKDACGY
ncbi:hypothetical protein QCBJ_16565 [Pseudomonas sp. QC2]|nr:hypothetical protein QCBJ_16565 [Pseudomonas sp. QC2]